MSLTLFAEASPLSGLLLEVVQDPAASFETVSGLQRTYCVPLHGSTGEHLGTFRRSRTVRTRSGLAALVLPAVQDQEPFLPPPPPLSF